ncbi:MAG TPA: TPM domain-containing protein [Tepidisphaeraceae bacterium]|jgi:uncharacterized membrane protein|nr:TPM domain-containing protein [Tepidisphaeraceae bacterium]
MNYLEFLIHLDDDRIVEAIRSAERRTGGEIRVYIAREQAPLPVNAAIEQFHRMGMTDTRERNGVLIFVAPRSQTFAIIGDEGLHRHVGPDYWGQITEQMGARFPDDPTGAIVHAIERTGERLATHFPRRPDDRNELPDRVQRG